MKIKECESRLELEQATRSRLEVQFNRYKDSLEKAQQEASQMKAKEISAQEALKKTQKTLRWALTAILLPAHFLTRLFIFCRELREEHNLLVNRENDNASKRKDLELKNSNSESEISLLKNDLRLALQRIADLQQAMEGEGDEDDDDDLSDRWARFWSRNFHVPKNIVALFSFC